MRRCCLYALALAACSSGKSNVQDAGSIPVTSNSCATTSGSRLKANYWVTGDGGRYFAGTWHDTMLGHDCAFGTLPGDPQIYCLPTSDGMFASEFSDDTCSTPVVDVDPSCSVTAPIFSFMHMGSTGNPALDFYAIAGAYTGSRWEQNGCRAATDSAPAGYEFHTVGAPLDKGMFATATAYTATGMTRLKATGYMSPDGAIEACTDDTFYDSQRSETCHVRTDDVGKTRCMPNGYAFSDSGVYADTSCKTIAGLLSAAPALAYETVDIQLTCGIGTKVYKLSGPLTVEYANTGAGDCMMLSPALPNYYTAGPEITPDHFAALTDAPLATSGPRLQEILHGADDGFGMSSGTFSDTQLGGASCRFTTAADGTTRCLPGDPTIVPHIGTVYSDSTCKTLIPIIVPTCAGGAPAFAQVVETPTMHATCSYQGATHVYPVAAMVTDTLYEVTASGCTESTYTGSAYALGDELPATTFVQATIAP